MVGIIISESLPNTVRYHSRYINLMKTFILNTLKGCIPHLEITTAIPLLKVLTQTLVSRRVGCKTYRQPAGRKHSY